MPKYEVELEWSGYSRGRSTYLVEAKNEEEALENYYEGTRIAREVVRDDTEAERDYAVVRLVGAAGQDNAKD